LAVVERALRRTDRELLEIRAPALPISRCVDRHVDTFTLPLRDDCIDEVLNRVDRLPVAADEDAGIAPGARHVQAVLVLAYVDAAVDAERRRDSLDELPHVTRQLALVLPWLRDD